jgi:hypothetical protein
MPELKSLDNVYLVLAFLVPGLVASFVRAQFITGRLPSHREAALTYLTLSVIYYALVLPAVDYAMSVRQPGYQKTLIWFGLVFHWARDPGALART